MAASWCHMKYIYRNFGLKLYRSASCQSQASIVAPCTYWMQCYSTVNRSGTHTTETKSPFSTQTADKKDVSAPLPTNYSPEFVESGWYEWWQSQGYFQPSSKTRTDANTPFVVLLPPPNVTGTLHLGHALTNAIQDAIVRWHRMQGRPALWVPGCDHAGIATQVVVEKQLWQEQRKTRHQLGRQAFVQHVWRWKHEKGEKINEQMRRLGSSLDWSRACFTMDEKLSEAVVEAFVRLHDEGLIYRNNRLVNWSCALQSTISDIEVDSIAVEGRTLLPVPGYDKKVPFGVLQSFAYPVHQSSEEVVVSTTRLETMLGDVAVAVHPADARYTHLHGRQLLHPLSGRLIPVVCDDVVDVAFGTGAVKVTPAHDPTDFQIAEKLGLDMPTVIDDAGNMANVPDDLCGVRRFDARRKVAQMLTEIGLYRGDQDHSYSIPICSRSKDIIEPRLKEQWFIKCSDMAQTAVHAVLHGDLQLVPRSHEKVWLDWLHGIRDWCISRQLWWGHRIPAYRIVDQNKSLWVCGRTEADAKRKAALKLGVSEEEITLEQDEDVLDTWFSSAVYPFSVMGWPHKTQDFERYYPSNLLETGSDIIFFWVARMVMMGVKLTGQLPFKQVLLHGMLRDAFGRKMSKSLGNIIDPMDVIHGKSLAELQDQVQHSNLDPTEVKRAQEGQRKDFPQGIPECGADALRFTLCSYDFKAGEINMDVTHARSYRHFCNKVWQAFRFVDTNLGNRFQPPKHFEVTDSYWVVDRWILSRLSHMIKTCDEHFKTYDLHLVTKSLLQFWLTEFCDVYLESIKPVLRSGLPDEQACIHHILYLCMETYLRAISPFMPFLAEELFQRLPSRGGNWPDSVCIAEYPLPKQYPWYNSELDQNMTLVRDIAHEALSIRKELNLTKARASAFVTCTDPKLMTELSPFRLCLQTLSRSQDCRLLSDRRDVPDGCVHIAVTDTCTLSIKLQHVVDPEQDLPKLGNKLRKLEQQLQFLTGKKHKSDSEDRKSVDKIETVKIQIKKMQNIVSVVENLQNKK